MVSLKTGLLNGISIRTMDIHGFESYVVYAVYCHIISGFNLEACKNIDVIPGLTRNLAPTRNEVLNQVQDDSSMVEEE